MKFLANFQEFHINCSSLNLLYDPFYGIENISNAINNNNDDSNIVHGHENKLKLA